jgi:hypothetical protein
LFNKKLIEKNPIDVNIHDPQNKFLIGKEEVIDNTRLVINPIITGPINFL